MGLGSSGGRSRGPDGTLVTQPDEVGQAETAPEAVLFSKLLETRSFLFLPQSRRGRCHLQSGRWPCPSLKEGVPSNQGGANHPRVGRKEGGGFGKLLKSEAPIPRGPYLESNLDFHPHREPGLNQDLQIRSFTHTPPPPRL